MSPDTTRLNTQVKNKIYRDSIFYLMVLGELKMRKKRVKCSFNSYVKGEDGPTILDDLEENTGNCPHTDDWNLHLGTEKLNGTTGLNNWSQ